MTDIATPSATIPFERRLTEHGKDVFDSVEWTRRDVAVGPFKQEGVEFPTTWTQNAANIVAQKYFRGQVGTPAREDSVKQMIGRVAKTITAWGRKQGYFHDAAAQRFHDELTYILLHQMAAFNSPVWFNVGFEDEPQCSACFILSVEDSLEDVLDWNSREGRVFRGGSGSGADLSNLRGSMEQLSKGGLASGPVSFMRGPDAWAGTIASGGKTRRAAKMVTLLVDHPDIRAFVGCKALEEERLAVLKEAGLIEGIDDTASVGSYQNANNSVRVTDLFMRKATGEDPDPNFDLISRSPHTPGKILDTLHAPTLLKDIAKAAWRCADPGVQFTTLINDWHTSPATGPINSSNPCSEYLHVDNSACNLSSINLLKMRRPDGSIDYDLYRHVIDIMLTAQDILVESSSYPDERIKEVAHSHHQLGLGYTNLGALLMANGLAYDSSEGRDLAAALTSMMTGRAYRMSALLAKQLGPYAAWDSVVEIDGDELSNAVAHHNVIRKHTAAATSLALKTHGKTKDLADMACQDWADAQALTAEHGQRCAQVTLLAPTGTISFLMDCDTTGVEPPFSLVTYKALAGGGNMVIVNQTVRTALEKLGYYAATTTNDHTGILENEGTEAFLASIQPEHRPIFHGANDISPRGHIKMMGAVQPFLSGAISKTVNLPETATVEDIEEAIVYAWKEGIKALAVYRDGSKGAAPLSTKITKTDGTSHAGVPVRNRLPTTRQSITHKFSIGQFEGYITAGLYPDGTLGEIFLSDIGKDGSTLLGMTNAFATEVSTGLQYGKPVDEFVRKHVNRTFEPHGITGNPEIRFCTSIVDYVAKWVALTFGSPELKQEVGLDVPSLPNSDTAPAQRHSILGELCPNCSNHSMHRTGTCKTCSSCGMNTGCGG